MVIFQHITQINHKAKTLYIFAFGKGKLSPKIYTLYCFG